MRKRKKDRRRQAISDLNLTNLIDVVFALLIIFMITAPMMTQGIQVDLPQTESKAVEASETIQVTVTAENEILIGEITVSRVDFTKRFKEEFAGRSEVPVFVNADKSVPYGIVAWVLSEIQNAGVVKLGFLTAPLEKQGGAIDG